MSQSSASALVAENLVKNFQQGNTTVQALRGVSLKVEHGEFVAIMGASGSGKSTLLHLMAGLATPDGGSIAIDGHPVEKMGDRALTIFRRRKVGLIFQAYNLMPHLSAEENIQLPLLLDGRAREARQRSGELLESLGLTPRRTHRPYQLSGGEQQRTAIARALISEPTIVLADEPTGNLDSVAGKAVCESLQKMAVEQQCAIVMVTHDPAVAYWASRVILIGDGLKVGELLTADFSGPEALAVHYQDAIKNSQAEAPCLE